MKKKIAVITSGGDASGVNAAFYGLVCSENIELLGINGGYDGIVRNKPFQLDQQTVRNAVLRGEALVQTARSRRPLTVEGRSQIIRSLREKNIESLVVCGGNGSGKAADLLQEEGFPTLLLPMTIDNNVYGSTYSMGYYTALENMRRCLQVIQQTSANMPDRVFMVETFGGDAGQLALAGALYGGADVLLLPETRFDLDSLVERIQECLQERRQCCIVSSEAVFLPGAEMVLKTQGSSLQIGKVITEKLGGKRIRHTILGYMQRAGDPCMADIEKSMALGRGAAEAIQAGMAGLMIGLTGNQVCQVSLKNIAEKKKALVAEEYAAAQKLRMIP